MVGDEGTGMGVRGISGGERKRVTVGVGLVTQPHVLLLDEPTSGLDSETAVSIVELMRDLARQVSICHRLPVLLKSTWIKLMLAPYGICLMQSCCKVPLLPSKSCSDFDFLLSEYWSARLAADDFLLNSTRSQRWKRRSY